MEPGYLLDTSLLENATPFDQLLSQFQDLEIQYAFKSSENAAIDKLFDVPADIEAEMDQRKRVSKLVYLENITDFQFEDFLEYLYKKKNGDRRLVSLSMWINARGAVLSPAVHSLDKRSIDAICDRVVKTYGESFTEPHLERSDLEWIVKLALLVDLGQNATTQFRSSGLSEQDKNPHILETLEQACNFFTYHIKGAAKALHRVVSTSADYAEPTVVDIHCGTPLFALITAYLFDADARLLCSSVRNESRNASVVYCMLILTFLDCVEQLLPRIPLTQVKDYSFVEMLAAELATNGKQPCKGATMPSMINVLKRAPYLISSKKIPIIPNAPLFHLPTTAAALALRNLSVRESLAQKVLMCPFPDSACKKYVTPTSVEKIEGVEIIRRKGNQNMEEVFVWHPTVKKWVTGIMTCSKDLYINVVFGVFPKQ